jgi:hypothetical protein
MWGNESWKKEFTEEHVFGELLFNEVFLSDGQLYQ